MITRSRARSGPVTARDGLALASVAPSALRNNERIHDVTATFDSVVAPSATRLFVVYKVNSAFARTRDTFSGSLTSARFNVQVNQSLPFISFAQRELGDARGGQQPVWR